MGQSIKKVFNREYSLMIQTSILYTYFKLMPQHKILHDAPSIIFKYVSMIIIDILFFRIKYLKILVKSWRNIWNQRSVIINNRRLFFQSTESVLSFSELRAKIKWFFPFDCKRFWKILILGDNSSIDEYSTTK